jgi:hypothetical protein
MTVTKPPCRLDLILATGAPIAVVLRRGPSAWSCLSLWRTDTDTFEHGQWMHNRVYSRRCDLSADGSLFVYFAYGGSKHDPAPGADSWVAVSRPPWFTALALWWMGTTYYTGGLFPDGRSLRLGFDASAPDRGSIPDWYPRTEAPPPVVDRTNEWTDRTVWLSRLWRIGWRPVAGAGRETWERRSPAGDRTLLMSWPVKRGAHGASIGIEYALVTGSSDLLPLGVLDWADWDQTGRLVFAAAGRMCEWMAPGQVRVLEDFNLQSPDPRPAPPGALVWPKPPPARRAGS